MSTLLFVFNPTAGRGLIQEDLFEIIDRFTAHGYLVTAYPTQKQADAYHIIQEIGSQYDTVVCSGGDGTLNEAVDALMTLGHKPPFGYLPAGSTNDFASSMNLPTDIFEAVDTIVEGIPLPIHIGQFQDDFFSYVAAFGLFTDVSYGTPQSLKNMFGHAAYVLEGVKRLTNVKSWHCKVTYDGKTIEDDFIFGMVTNSASVGGFTLPTIQQDTGTPPEFQLILLRRMDNLLDLQRVIRVLLGRQESSEYFFSAPIQEVTITSDEPLAWTLDGEYGGSYSENHIQIHRNALQIMTPKE